MKGITHMIRRTAVAASIGMAASLSFAGEAQAAFTGPGIYKIKLADTNLVLDVDSTCCSGGASGRRLLLWGTNNGANQRFIILADGDGYVIRPAHSLLCLDRPYRSLNIGTELQQFGCNGDQAQRFYISFGAHTLIRVSANRVLLARREGDRIVIGESTTPDGRFLSSAAVFEFERM